MNLNFSVDCKFLCKEQWAFEQLATNLFLYGHNQPYELFRYHNQTAIETEPARVDGKVIGFQTIYFEDSTR